MILIDFGLPDNIIYSFPIVQPTICLGFWLTPSLSDPRIRRHRQNRPRKVREKLMTKREKMKMDLIPSLTSQRGKMSRSIGQLEMEIQS